VTSPRDKRQARAEGLELSIPLAPETLGTVLSGSSGVGEQWSSGHILLSKHFAGNLEHNAHLQTRYQTLMVLDSLADPEIVGRL
jgi:hypothetical protein